jgi:hypothetical protein
MAPLETRTGFAQISKSQHLQCWVARGAKRHLTSLTVLETALKVALPIKKLGICQAADMQVELPKYFG